MTVAIALERFIAVHYPIDYSQAMHEANALSKRILKYVSAVIILSIVFTITRWNTSFKYWMEKYLTTCQQKIVDSNYSYNFYSFIVSTNFKRREFVSLGSLKPPWFTTTPSTQWRTKHWTTLSILNQPKWELRLSIQCTLTGADSLSSELFHSSCSSILMLKSTKISKWA
jgi:hypothetical protein